MESMIGKTLGQYQLVGQIGKGGMATVYKAYQPGLDRYVAIKILPAFFANEPDFAARFTREAQAIARLDHPHILPVYDFGKQGDVSFIVMKYVPAGTLHDRLGTPMSPLEAVEIIDQIAAALDSAHGQGILHRDVKPGNILIDDRDWIYLSDFGLAKMTEGSAQLTGTGVGVGTPSYMSPEQGKGLPVDARTDVYALGVILFEMMTGRVPYEAETPLAVVIKHVTDPIPLPRQVNPNVPEPVERVLLKAMAKERDHRFASAGELAAALRSAVQGLDPTVAAAPITVDQDATRLNAAAPRATTGPQPHEPTGPADLASTSAEKPAAAADDRKFNWLLTVAVLALLIAGGLALIAGWLLLNNRNNQRSVVNPASTTPAALAALPTNTPLPTGTSSPPPTATVTPEPVVNPVTPTDTATATPSPSFTPTSTATATPTSTPSPSPTASHTPAPSWPDTGLRPDGRFADIWTSLDADQGVLGYPVAGREGDRLCARQKFERGYMIWFDRGDADLVWTAVVPDAAASRGSTAFRFSDQWPGNPEYWCAEATARAPIGPKRGFGMLWCIYPDMRAGIGYGIEEEVGGPNYPRCEGQLFQGGAIVHNPLDATYWVFIDSGGWYRFGE